MAKIGLAMLRQEVRNRQVYFSESIVWCSCSTGAKDAIFQLLPGALPGYFHFQKNLMDIHFLCQSLPATTAARAQHVKDWKEKGVKFSPSMVTSQLKIQTRHQQFFEAYLVLFWFWKKKKSAKLRNYLQFCFFTELLQMLNGCHEAFDFSWNVQTHSCIISK